MRTPLIAGNWKMHGTLSKITTLINDISVGAQSFLNEQAKIDLLVIPTFVHLSKVQELLTGSYIMLGAQDLFIGAEGAYTGEVSGMMLKELGCRFVLIGHSERRQLFHEDLTLVAQKFKAAKEAKLQPILCIGETQKEREQGKTEDIICEQLQSVIDLVGIEAFKEAVIAYEPVWAIGTGLTATPEQAQAVHAFIRELIAQNNVDLAGTIRILYGGSMKAENAAALLAMPDIDGGLIGGASLEANSFLAIARKALDLEVVCTK